MQQQEWCDLAQGIQSIKRDAEQAINLDPDKGHAFSTFSTIKEAAETAMERLEAASGLTREQLLRGESQPTGEIEIEVSLNVAPGTVR